MRYNIASIHRKAPDLLLEKLAEVNSNLSKQDKKSKPYEFWKSVSDVMKFAYGYMNDFNYIVRENELLRAENEFLKSMTREMIGRLELYEGIKAEMMAGTFEDVVERVNKSMGNE